MVMDTTVPGHRGLESTQGRGMDSQREGNDAAVPPDDESLATDFEMGAARASSWPKRDEDGEVLATDFEIETRWTSRPKRDVIEEVLDTDFEVGAGGTSSRTRQDEVVAASRGEIVQILEPDGREVPASTVIQQEPQHKEKEYNLTGHHSRRATEVTEQQGLLWASGLMSQAQELKAGSHQPRGFKRGRGAFTLALAQTFMVDGKTTMDDVSVTRKMFQDAQGQVSAKKKQEYLRHLEKSTSNMMNSDKAANTRYNWGVAANAWSDFVEATGIAPFMPYVPVIGHPLYESTVEYIKRTYAMFIRHQLDVTRPKDGVLADPETASSYASTVARGFERIGLDHLEIAAPVIARARSGAQRLSIQIRGRREKIKKAAFPIEMLKSWYDDVDEELVAGTLQGTILTMIQYAAQVGPRRSEYTEGDIKFDPKTDLTRANINYYLRDEEGNETKLEPTPEGIREFLSTTDQNTSRAGIRPPLMKNDQFGKRMGRWETPIPLN